MQLHSWWRRREADLDVVPHEFLDRDRARLYAQPVPDFLFYD